mgnify:CR=1 FL=1
MVEAHWQVVSAAVVAHKRLTSPRQAPEKHQHDDYEQWRRTILTVDKHSMLPGRGWVFKLKVARERSAKHVHWMLTDVEGVHLRIVTWMGESFSMASALKAQGDVAWTPT